MVVTMKARDREKRLSEIRKQSKRVFELLDTDPYEAIRQVRLIDLDDPAIPDKRNAMNNRASILIDAGAITYNMDAIREGLQLFRELHASTPCSRTAYNLANALLVKSGNPPDNSNWVDHKEETRLNRAEARRHYWNVAQDASAKKELRTQALTNLGNQLTRSYRLGEAHDIHRRALRIDPQNGAAAGFAARDLMWLYNQGICSETTRTEAIYLAQIAKRNEGRVREYAGERVAKELSQLADELGEPPPLIPHKDPFVQWIELERLTLAPAVELIDPSLGKIDWLMLPDIMEQEPGPNGATPPPIFAMFNMLKADFVLARDLAWRSIHEAGRSSWPGTGRYSDTLDFAAYGPDVSALILAHRTALDLLDKVAVTANYYFKIGLPPGRVYFARLWRKKSSKKNDSGPLLDAVDAAIREGANALYGLVELAEDFDSENGILRPQKDLRNAGTHRFVALHDIEVPPDCRQVSEIERVEREQFASEALSALRVARSAIQMLALAIRQRERSFAQKVEGPVGTMVVPDHDWKRGND